MALDSIHLMLVFARVAEAESFTLAARRLEISPSAASKAVARLEEKLGVPLVLRTTRSLRLTEEGEALLETCRHILSEIEEVEAKLTRERTVPRGRVRIQSSVAFGRLVLVPLLFELNRRHPELTIDVDLSDRIVNLTEEGIDLAFRLGELADSGLAARKLGHMQFVTVASPAYLERHGVPKVPADLAAHRCLGYFLPDIRRYRDWQFTGTGTRESPSAHLNINNAQVLVDAAIDGQGIVSVASLVAFDAVRSGLLRLVLADHVTQGPAISMLYPSRRYRSPRVSALVDFLVARIPKDSRWQTLP
ncbi:LysR family transcriptional regulator [Aquabacter sp. CN5-332]|uniref:LysR family transcriptional regulator n=1 Tax=Aquabacter sp. CN5-332 TaxID=3156608 RepID=UPI0032B448A4